MTRKLAVVCSIAMAFVIFAGMAQAQTSPYRVDYFSRANTGGAPDATLRLDNDGSGTLPDGGNVTPGGDINLCADIYVFDASEEMSECCSCLETPDGLRTLSVDSNLTSNPLTGVVLNTGVIKIVAALPTGGACPVPTRITLAGNGEIQSWATHIQTGNVVTETASQVSNLSASEETNLAQQCGAIVRVGSGKGICNCGTGTGS